MREGQTNPLKMRNGASSWVRGALERVANSIDQASTTDLACRAPVRFADLKLHDLLDAKADGGVIRFAGHRTLLLDPVALGLLKKELVDALGLPAAKSVFCRMGYIHGRRTAQALKDAFPWDTVVDWCQAGGRMHTLQGLVRVVAPDSTNISPAPRAHSIWHDSYEAEQHLAHFGRSETPVCWTLCGFASGYLSFSRDAEIYVAETRCLGCGDTECEVVGRRRDEWGATGESLAALYRTENLHDAIGTIAEALRSLECRARSDAETAKLRPVPTAIAGFVANSPVMRKVLDLAVRVAKADATVLVTGESGVGKERISRLIHQESPRVAQPFVAVNCGAVTETLLESELFGHVKGAFSGASTDRIGLFEAAHGGTLFLDEIGEISPAMQVKLLRVLQEREVRRVGENKSRTVDVRIVAATNKDLSSEVSAGRFRQDLFYRLRVIELKIPPLRARVDDLLTLARSIADRAAERLGRDVRGFTPAAAARLLEYPWPGNVRELENVLERAVILGDGSRIDLDALPDELLDVPGAGGDGSAASRSLATVEREHILAVLKEVGGNRARTAQQLGIGLATLYRKLKEYGVRSEGD